MIAFASLFLGLVLGPRPVELVVGEPVAAVELRLDGRQVGVLREPPWQLVCDFGTELAPRHLEAVARDAGGRELGRAEQWINLPQPRARLSVVLEPRAAGAPRVARLSWESIAGAEPKSVSASLDGTALAVADPHRITLPAVDESFLHLLQVEMEFEGRVTSRADVTFGGAYTEEVSTEITALPLWATGTPRRPPTAASVEGWFEKGGEPLRVIAVEKETAEAVVIMDRPFPRLFGPGESYKPPKSLRLPADFRLRVLTTVPEESQGVATTFSLFPISPAYDGGLGDLYELLTHIGRPDQDREPRLNAAVAVAGLAAYEGRHRRAVVLIPAARGSGGDGPSPDQVRRYLERLRVPFYVWNPESGAARDLAAWGRVDSVGSIKQLAAAFDELLGELERQWIVWLDGQHLPQDIELSPRATGFTLTR